MAPKGRDDLVVKRVINAEIFLILSGDVIKAIGNSVPVTIRINKKNDSSYWNTIKMAIETSEEIEITLLRMTEPLVKKKDEKPRGSDPRISAVDFP